MIIKEEDLLNYMSCPIKYLTSHNGYDIKRKTFSSCQYDSFNYLISKYTYEGINNLDLKIKKYWDKVCYENQDIIKNINVIHGWGRLYKAYEYLYNNRPKIMDLNVPYTLDIPGTDYTITGQLNILIDRGTQIEVLVPSFSTTKPDEFRRRSDLKCTIDALAIKQIYNKMAVFTFCNFNQGTSDFAIRNTKDFDRLYLIIENVCKGIENNIVYPHYGYECNSCNIKHLCSSWGATSNLNPYNPFKDGKR